MKCHPCILAVFLLILQYAESSHKKGLGLFGWSSYICGDDKAFPNTHWWYNWRTSPAEHVDKNCTYQKPGYVPTLWGNGWAAVTALNISTNYHYILGFNEPNHAEQTNMTPSMAAAHWKHVTKHAQGKILVSPSAAPCGHCQFDTISWFEEFFRLCDGCRVDHIATHAYYCNTDQFMDYLKQIWDRFHKPIWVTEFACMRTSSVNDQLQFMKEILPKLEAAPFVFRYAWFASRWNGDGFVTSSSSLLHQDSSELTTLGHYYNNFMR